jgi:hypothetical protein
MRVPPVFTPAARQIVPDATGATIFWVALDPRQPEQEPFTDEVPIAAWLVTAYEQTDRWGVPLTHADPILATALIGEGRIFVRWCGRYCRSDGGAACEDRDEAIADARQWFEANLALLQSTGGEDDCGG